jgi:hypothetical protein
MEQEEEQGKGPAPFRVSETLTGELQLHLGLLGAMAKNTELFLATEFFSSPPFRVSKTLTGSCIFRVSKTLTGSSI